MHIGIDGACWTNRRGYGRFLRELIGATLELHTDHRFSLVVEAHQPVELPPGNIRIVPVATAVELHQAASASSRRSIADLLRMSRAVARERFDLFFFPSVYSYFPLWGPAAALVGIHDTMADRHPEFAFASRRQQWFWQAKVRMALWQARMILTVSEYSRRSIEETFGIAPSKIRVVGEAPSRLFEPDETARPEPYVLYAGGISPNKNLVRLVNAFAACASRFPAHRLILVGDYERDGFMSCYAEVKAAVEQRGIGDRVTFTGFVDDQELKRLYQRASVFVFPSLEEGFGLPPLEAMACGAPVVASRNSALEEVLGDAGLLLDPTDEGAISEAITAVLGNPELAGDLRARSRRHAKQFSWTRAAQQFLSVCEETMRGR